eukprot:scaffold44685_cov33-Tisochrysis_lutea.AAC.1
MRFTEMVSPGGHNRLRPLARRSKIPLGEDAAPCLTLDLRIVSRSDSIAVRSGYHGVRRAASRKQLLARHIISCDTHAILFITGIASVPCSQSIMQSPRLNNRAHPLP